MRDDNEPMTSTYPQPAHGLKRWLYGAFFGASVSSFVRLLPFFARRGLFGIALAFVFIIGAIGLFVLLELGLMIVMNQFQVSPAGQFVTLLLSIGGGLFAVYLWVGRQSRSTGGVLRLVALTIGLSVLAWLVWNSGFFTDSRLDYMVSTFEAQPVRYVSEMYGLVVLAVLGGLAFARGSQRFVRDAYRSPVHFIWAVLRLTLMIVVIAVIVWYVVLSGYVDWRTGLDEALNMDRFRE
jgi:hypothetical protein